MYSDGTMLSVATTDPLSWINAQLGKFLAVPSRIARLRTKADFVIAHAPKLGADAARRARSRLGLLEGVYNTIASKLRIQGGGQLAAVIPPVVIAIVGGVTAVVVISSMALLFKKLEIEEKIINGLEAGTLDQADITALEHQRESANQDDGPLENFTKMTRYALYGGLALLALKAFETYRA